MEPPDRLEKQVRFGCGFILGCVIAVGALLTSLWSVHSMIAWCVIAGLICGYAAMKLGDAFWERAIQWWIW